MKLPKISQHIMLFFARLADVRLRNIFNNLGIKRGSTPLVNISKHNYVISEQRSLSAVECSHMPVLSSDVHIGKQPKIRTQLI